MVLNADLLKYFFGTSVLDEISEDSISALVEQYPYFVHPHWISVIKKWNQSHNQLDLQDAGVYTFNPSRLKQYCTDTFPSIASDSVHPSSESERPISEISSQDMSNSTSFPDAERPLAETFIQNENNPPEINTENNITQEGKKEESSETLEAAEGKSEDKPVSGQNETYSEPVIQPLFTQDYFAYTGAKLPEQIQNDKKPTMEQLRSFTGWLRTMKRSSVYSSDPDSDGEKIIPNMDNDINFDQEAVTETMAEVRASKGHYDKAIAIYEKLSLSNPEKSAYFAQKIEDLKNK